MILRLASPVVSAGIAAAAAWRSFKTIKRGEVDYDLLIIWVALAAYEVFELTFEFLVSWLPFYHAAKLCLQAYLLHPNGQLPRLIEIHAMEPLMEVVDEAVDKVVMPILTVIIVDLPTHLLDLFFPSSQESFQSPHVARRRVGNDAMSATLDVSTATRLRRRLSGGQPAPPKRSAWEEEDEVPLPSKLDLLSPVANRRTAWERTKAAQMAKEGPGRGSATEDRRSWAADPKVTGSGRPGEAKAWGGEKGEPLAKVSEAARAIHSPVDMDIEEEDGVHEYEEDDLADSSYRGGSAGDRGDRPRSVGPGLGGGRGAAKETTGTKGIDRPSSARTSRDPTARRAVQGSTAQTGASCPPALRSRAAPSSSTASSSRYAYASATSTSRGRAAHYSRSRTRSSDDESEGGGLSTPASASGKSGGMGTSRGGGGARSGGPVRAQGKYELRGSRQAP